jgi:hypothetical protein
VRMFWPMPISDALVPGDRNLRTRVCVPHLRESGVGCLRWCLGYKYVAPTELDHGSTEATRGSRPIMGNARPRRSTRVWCRALPFGRCRRQRTSRVPQGYSRLFKAIQTYSRVFWKKGLFIFWNAGGVVPCHLPMPGSEILRPTSPYFALLRSRLPPTLGLHGKRRTLPAIRDEASQITAGAAVLPITSHTNLTGQKQAEWTGKLNKKMMRAFFTLNPPATPSLGNQRQAGIPLIRPADTFSPTGGEGWVEGEFPIRLAWRDASHPAPPFGRLRGSAALPASPLCGSIRVHSRPSRQRPTPFRQPMPTIAKQCQPVPHPRGLYLVSRPFCNIHAGNHEKTMLI